MEVEVLFNVDIVNNWGRRLILFSWFVVHWLSAGKWRWLGAESLI